CEICIESHSLACVQNSVIGEVFRRVRLVRGYKTDEVVLRHWLQRVIHPPLIAECGNRVRRKILPTERAGAVRGVDEGFVRQRQKLGMERVVQMRAEFRGSPAKRSAQIRPADVSNEECVAGKNREWLRLTLRAIEYQNGDGLNRMARCLQHPEAHPWKLERVAVGHRDKFVFRLGATAQVDRGAALVAQLEMTGDEIGVEVREEDVPDFESEP